MYAQKYIKGDVSMHNIAKIRLDEKEKEKIEQYKRELLDYLKILDEFDMNSTYEKTENAENNGV